MDRLSSRFTVPLKMVFAAVIAYAALTTAYTTVREGTALVGRLPEASLVVLLAVAAWTSLAGLKQVSLDGRDLVMSDFRRSVRVDVQRLVDVHPEHNGQMTITLTFDGDTGLGTRVRFMPAAGGWRSRDRIVTRLRGLAGSREGVSA